MAIEINNLLKAIRCSTFAASLNCQPMLSCFKNYVLSSNGIVMKVDRLVMLFLNADAIDEEWLSP
jgi:elongation factor P--beta-lysine ligase